MRILSLNLKNFRNISNMELLPAEEMNVIYGENAQGKTNIIEALWLLTGAKSFRGAKDEELIKFGTERANIEGNFIGEEIEKQISIEIMDKRRAFLNQKPLKSASKLAGSLNAIIFSPTDLRLLSDGPKLRRKFLDTAICQLYPTYIDILRDYTRAVSQRNRILKDFKYNSALGEMLIAFENEIAEKGSKIIRYRKRYIEILKEFLPTVYSGISDGKENLETEYISSLKGEDFLGELIAKRQEDMYSGKTSVGPHRDDLEFKINGISAKSFGSQGQKRSVALSLKLSEAEVIRQSTGESPICLLDDIMSELDMSRQGFILNHIKGMQTFLSCCDPETVKSLKAGKSFHIAKGEVI